MENTRAYIETTMLHSFLRAFIERGQPKEVVEPDKHTPPVHRSNSARRYRDFKPFFGTPIDEVRADPYESFFDLVLIIL